MGEDAKVWLHFLHRPFSIRILQILKETRKCLRMLPQTLSLWVWQLTMNLWFSPQFKNLQFFEWNIRFPVTINVEVRCYLATGRTHQIRVHLLHLGFPTANDSTWTQTKVIKWENIRCLHLFFFLRLLWGWASSCGELSIFRCDSRVSYLIPRFIASSSTPRIRFATGTLQESFPSFW